MDSYSFEVPAFSIPYSNKYLSSSLRLNQFQSEILGFISKERDILLTAPTGSGKTLTLLLNTEHAIKVGDNELYGFVALYPNNTLLGNQLCTLEDIVLEHLGGSLVYTSELGDDPPCVEGGKKRMCGCRGIGEGDSIKPLAIYEVNQDVLGSNWVHTKYVGFLTLSGRYIQSSYGIPKRDVLYRLAEKVFSYARKGGVYFVVFATPDTYLLVSTGAYRDFESVGKALHNILLGIYESRESELEDILRETGVIPRSHVDELVAVTERLLDLPLFIDEFHLYGPYELDALYALLRLYKERTGYPVVFSSATPAEESISELGLDLKLERVEARIETGADGFAVRGRTVFEIIPVPTSRKGLPAFFEASEMVYELAEGLLMKETELLKRGRGLIVLERLWMVAELAKRLSDMMGVECIASIVPSKLCRPGSSVIIGSEATTQGVNLGRVTLLITGGTSSEDVVQRVGRAGRKGVDSKVYLVAPKYAVDENPPRSGVMNYYDMVDWIRSVYPDYPKRKRDVSNLVPEKFHVYRRKLIYGLGVASLARVSGMRGILGRIGITREETGELLDKIIGPPESLASILVFRRNGFNVKIRVEGEDDIREASIGIVSRNFRIVKALADGVLLISLERSRQPVGIYVSGDPSKFSGRLVELRLLLELLNGRLMVGEHVVANERLAGTSLVYVLDAGSELSEYLSYTGEGATIVSPGGSRYAVLFV